SASGGLARIVLAEHGVEARPDPLFLAEARDHHGDEGLIHSSEAGVEPPAKIETAFTVGSEVAAKVIKVDKKDRKIGLSIKTYKKDMEKADVADYLKTQDDIDLSLGAVARKVNNKKEDE
ncbi:MAG: S1 RNA-binding domain-containing protein, partial [Nitrospirota bacterium]